LGLTVNASALGRVHLNHESRSIGIPCFVRNNSLFFFRMNQVQRRESLCYTRRARANEGIHRGLATLVLHYIPEYPQSSVVLQSMLQGVSVFVAIKETKIEE